MGEEGRGDGGGGVLGEGDGENWHFWWMVGVVVGRFEGKVGFLCGCEG